MPSYRGHLIGGFLTYVGILQLLKNMHLSGFMIIQGLIFCLLGALFPDIDVKSKGQKVFYSMLLVLLIWLLYKKMYCLFAVMSLLGIIPILVRHRGIFHHIWFLFSMAVISTLVIRSQCGGFENMMLYNCWFFFAGTVSHVVLDRFISGCKKLF